MTRDKYSRGNESFKERWLKEVLSVVQKLNNVIVAFYSEASGTGKDTAADYAAEFLSRNGVQVVRDAFAWDGKVVCADALGVKGTREWKIAAVDWLKLGKGVEWDNGLSPVKVSGREFIIGLLGSPGEGTGIRGLDETFWTRQVIDRARTRAAWTVISDMRFVEEAEAVKAAGGCVVEITRESSLGHFNEQRIPAKLVDCVIANDGSIEELRLRVEQFLHERFASAAGHETT